MENKAHLLEFSTRLVYIIRDEEALMTFTKTLTQEDMIGSLALINTLCDQAGIVKDQLAAKSIRSVICAT